MITVLMKRPNIKRLVRLLRRHSNDVYAVIIILSSDVRQREAGIVKVLRDEGAVVINSVVMINKEAEAT